MQAYINLRDTTRTKQISDPGNELWNNFPQTKHNEEGISNKTMGSQIGHTHTMENG